jgi:hypothetical protein
MVERAEKKLYLDRMVCRDGAVASRVDDAAEEDLDGGKLMATLRFGCNAVFGANSKNHSLPTDADIEIITDRSRTEDFSTGKLKGGAEHNAEEFDQTKEFSSTTDFGGIDFKKIRDEHKKAKLPDSVNSIGDAWKKRQRKNRITMVQAKGSGYGSAAVPVLSLNAYDLQSGERSVFQQELGGRGGPVVSRKSRKQTFVNQDFCQVCGDGGEIILCPRCPVSVHAKCIGLNNLNRFLCCTHHHCIGCDKSGSAAGGFLFVCATCPGAYCEDCVPPESRMLERFEAMETLGYNIKNGTYIHCSPACEDVAVTEFNWSPPTATRGPCPPELDVTNFFGGQVDDTIVAPDEELIGEGRRRRQGVNYAAISGKRPSPATVSGKRSSPT